MGKERPDRRRYPRFIVGGRVEVRTTAVDGASLVNISLGGALVEHAQVVRPAAISYLDLNLHGKRVRLRCRVVWSVVDRQELELDGEGAMIYHTGLEFLDTSEGTRQMISDYIQALIDDGKVMVADDEVIRRSYTCGECGESFELADPEVRPVFREPRQRPVQAGDLFNYAHGTCQGTLTCVSGGPNVPWTSEKEA